jgi:hypothetical protein
MKLGVRLGLTTSTHNPQLSSSMHPKPQPSTLIATLTSTPQPLSALYPESSNVNQFAQGDGREAPNAFWRQHTAHGRIAQQVPGDTSRQGLSGYFKHLFGLIGTNVSCAGRILTSGVFLVHAWLKSVESTFGKFSLEARRGILSSLHTPCVHPMRPAMLHFGGRREEFSPHSIASMALLNPCHGQARGGDFAVSGSRWRAGAWCSDARRRQRSGSRTTCASMSRRVLRTTHDWHVSLY